MSSLPAAFIIAMTFLSGKYLKHLVPYLRINAFGLLTPMPTA